MLHQLFIILNILNLSLALKNWQTRQIYTCDDDMLRSPVKPSNVGLLDSPAKKQTLTLSTLMSTTVNILCLHYHLYDQLLKIKYAFNLETQIYVGT